MRKTLTSLAAALASALVLSGCASLAPDYQQPASPVPAQWPSGEAYAGDSANRATDAAKTAADIPWRQFILEPRLQKVIEQALDGSRDLRKALASVESARAQYGEQRAALFPTVSAGVSGNRSRSLTSDSTRNNNSSAIGQSYTASASVSSYELDLFGKVRSLSDAALESYLSSAEAARATRITLIGDTTNAWILLAADRSRLATARETLRSAEQSMGVTRKRLELGVAARSDLSDAETIYQQARADVASYTAAVAQDRNALELLAGGPVADDLLPDGLPAEGQSAGWLADVPAGLSSSVLLSRPDVQEAEHQLKAANANIGAARAAFFPSVSLTGSGGIASAALATLFSGGTSVWAFAPSISLPIFDGGANRAGLDYAKSQKNVYVAAYELTIQTAFKEVADALATRGTIGEQLSAQQDLVRASQESYTLAEARYTRGVDTYLAALVAQRTLYSAQQTLLTTRLNTLQSGVTLYRVLGGGRVSMPG
ncbi:efflux transporter outer membrane subunit [Variovorax sp. YR216]|uniref:efflux transporter outer membrane subunit n=1 Tax=Variovorax sp. YR216 TaxID=1882828 RepID=UPI00089884CC|nr:efflux transporter outer membrane subunit [Variovorax sp. YR216]SEB25634.1 outer membrane protein, multidrug efflux system [Variovorax sp. YR216]